jgi:hypothetical protein
MGVMCQYASWFQLRFYTLLQEERPSPKRANRAARTIAATFVVL